MTNVTTGGKMPIMEVFGPTIQGEGMVVGRKTVFVRTGGCDYSCAWCDSAFTWNGKEHPRMLSAPEVWDEICIAAKAHEGTGLNFDHVTISGGNPALIKAPMAELIELLHSNGIRVGLETQGSRWQDWMGLIDDLTISPKPPSSKMVTDWERLDEVIERLERFRGFYGYHYFFTLKVVVFDDVDYAYAQEVHKRYPQVPLYLSVGNEDPNESGDISQRLLQKLDWLWAKVIGDPTMNDVRPLPQLHTLVWANKRSV